MRADAASPCQSSSRPHSTAYAYCAGPGFGPAGRSIRELHRQQNDRSISMHHPDVDEAALWLAHNGHPYEICTQRGFLGSPTLTMFWGPGDAYGGKRELVACYDAAISELVIWNTGAWLNPESRALVEGAEKLPDITEIREIATPAGDCEIDLFAGILD